MWEKLPAMGVPGLSPSPTAERWQDWGQGRQSSKVPWWTLAPQPRASWRAAPRLRKGSQTLHTKSLCCSHVPGCRTQHKSIVCTSTALHITAKQRCNNNELASA